MKRIFTLLVSVLLAQTVCLNLAQTVPVGGIKPSGTLPILYINTENSTPIEQKETYIDAEYWLECNGYKNYEDLGSKSSPLKLGIRGRGNTSWRHDGQKPYKIKLDKKTSIMGMGKNKHWALLTRLADYQLYNELLAFEIGRKLEMPYVPQLRPVEVVLNGTYIGLYMLTETIRIDDNRLEIDEQPDGNEDPDILEGGWLVELDNNEEDIQISIPLQDRRNLLITPHTPEVLSFIQNDWLQEQFSQIVDYAYQKNNLDDRWENLIDVESLAKHMIVEELLHNFDGYQGSCYLHKQTGEKWKFGPLWDFSACWVYKTDLLAHHDAQLLIGEFVKFPSLRTKAREILNSYISKIGNDWVKPFLTDFYNEIKDAVKSSVKVWPDVPLDAKQGLDWSINANSHNLKFLQDYYNNNWKTYGVAVDITEKESSDSENFENLFSVKMNGVSKYKTDINHGDNVEIEIKANSEEVSLLTIHVNGVAQEINDKHYASVKLNNVAKDIYVAIVCENKDFTGIGTIKDEIEEYQYFNLNGQKINIEKAAKGIYIRNDGKKFVK